MMVEIYNLNQIYIIQNKLEIQRLKSGKIKERRYNQFLTLTKVQSTTILQ
jgi:translation initiation factor 2 gamma subunit (eIF-2gamma)